MVYKLAQERICSCAHSTCSLSQVLVEGVSILLSSSSPEARSSTNSVLIKIFVLDSYSSFAHARRNGFGVKAARVEIRERIQAELLRKSPPIPSTSDLCWHVADGLVLFFSTSRKAVALLEELFRESFGLGLVLQVPWLTGERMLDEAGRASLNELQPAVFL